MALRRRFFRKAVYYLRNGISPHKLALSVSLGLTLGIIPLYGLTFLIISLVILPLRLNFAAAHLAHYIVHPLQIVLIFPFLKIGDLVFDNTYLPGSMSQLIAMLKTDIWGTMHSFWLAYLSATVVWLIISIPLSIVLYRILVNLFRRLVPIRIR